MKKENIDTAVTEAVAALRVVQAKIYKPENLGIEPEGKITMLNGMINKALFEPRGEQESALPSINDALPLTLNPAENAKLIYNIRNYGGPLTVQPIGKMITAYRDAYVAKLSELEPEFTGVAASAAETHAAAEAATKRTY